MFSVAGFLYVLLIILLFHILYKRKDFIYEQKLFVIGDFMAIKHSNAIAKRKESALVKTRVAFFHDDENYSSIEKAYILFTNGVFLDEEHGWKTYGINRISEVVGKLRHGRYKINGIQGKPLRIIQWAPSGSGERCIYSLFEFAPKVVQEENAWIMDLTDEEMQFFNFNTKTKNKRVIKKKKKKDNNTIGQLSLSDLGIL